MPSSFYSNHTIQSYINIHTKQTLGNTTMYTDLAGSPSLGGNTIPPNLQLPCERDILTVDPSKKSITIAERNVPCEANISKNQYFKNNKYSNSMHNMFLSSFITTTFQSQQQVVRVIQLKITSLNSYPCMLIYQRLKAAMLPPNP